jgi:hypothetical protein
MMGVLGKYTLALFQGWDGGNEVRFNTCSFNFSFPNKFVLVLPCGLLVEYVQILKNVCFLKCLTGYPDYCGYEN